MTALVRAAVAGAASEAPTRTGREKGRLLRRDQAATESAFVIVDADQSRGQHLARSLRASVSCSISIFSSEGEGLAAVPRRVDVGVIELGSRAGGLGWASALARQDAEIVFFAADRDVAEVRAALSLGITRIVPADRLAEWLRTAAAKLAQLALARRLLREAHLGIPGIPPFDDGEAPGCPASLAVAEYDFRRSYLQQLLAAFPNKKAAATQARVPYRTLCAMIQKLGLD